MTNRESDIQVDWSEDEVRIFNEHGSILGIFENKSRELILRRGDVSLGFRGDGIMGRLLERSIVVANNIGARAISANITSREALDVSTRVFGEDSVTVRHYGEYENPDPEKPPLPPPDQRKTMATLLFTLEP